MSNVQDLKQYVKLHPDDRAQRWRLAKKLYMSGEFKSALKHLRVLRKQWPTKLNVARYLAATHYRLGNNSDAIRELERSLESWPDEIPIRQQLAHALEAEGLHSAAARTWKEILARQPNHPFAREALMNLKKQRAPQAAPAAAPEAGRKCPNCGAENGDEFERCWQCHAMLVEDAGPAAPEPQGAQARPPLIDLQDHTPVTIVSIFAALIAGMIAAYCIGDAWATSKTPLAELPAHASVYGVLARELVYLRICLAIVLAVFCPIALYAASFATRTPLPSGGTIASVGLAIAATSVAITCVPSSVLRYAPYLLIAGIFALTMWLFSPRYVRGAAIALVQCITVFGLSAGAAHQIEGKTFLTELPAIAAYAAEHDSKGTRGRTELPPVPLPVEYTFQFSSTGSEWLNERGADMRIDARTNDPSEWMDIELFEYEQPLEYFYADPVIVPFKAQLGRPYRLVLKGKQIPSTSESVLIGVLPVQIHPTSE